MSDKASRIKITPALIAGILVFVCFGVALYLRIALPYDRVFTDEWIKFVGSDSYFFMRIVDNLAYNFPHLNSIDPYMVYPGGMRIDSFPFYKYLLAGIIRIFSFGSPDNHIVDVISVYFPAVVGSLTVIPVYFIGKIVFNRWAGIIASALIAVSPGEFLGRTILGFVDHHAVEVLFITVMFLFLILAIQTATRRELDLEKIKQKQWSVFITPFVYSVIAGIFMGVFFSSWSGAPLFVFIIFIFYIIQFIIDHLRGNNTDYLFITAVITFLVALLVFLPFFDSIRHFIILLITFISLGVLGVLSWFMNEKGIRRIYYPPAIIICAMVGLGIFYAIDEELLRSLLGMFANVNRTGVGLTTLEAQPLLFPGGVFSLSVAWANFTTGLFFSVIALGFIIYYMVKNVEADKMLLLIWSVAIFMAALSMRRFAYYYAVNVALLTGYMAWIILKFAGFKEHSIVIARDPEKPMKKLKRKKQKQSVSNGTSGWNMKITGLIVVILIVIYPNIGPLPKIGPFPGGTKMAINTAKAIPYIPDNAWCEACDWLRENTSEPFGNADYYYAKYENMQQTNSGTLDAAYSVAAWWDYGYWIVRMAKRVPTCNPGSSGRTNTAKLFTVQSEKGSRAIIEKLNIKYIMIDTDTTTVKFYAVAGYSRKEENRFFEVYFQDEGNGMMRGDYYFYPEYYRSLAVRLYNFNGKEVVPDKVKVISYEDKVANGEPYKLITGSKDFADYETASDFIKQQSRGNYKIVGTDPFKSCVQLEALEMYRTVYESEAVELNYTDDSLPKVKIFEYIGKP